MKNNVKASVAFTRVYDNIQKKLFIDLNVSSKYSKLSNNGKNKIKAQWDTGAFMSAISNTLADMMELPIVSMTNIGTAAGIVSANIYIIDLEFPNGDIIPDLHVIGANLVDTNMLIGMDVISKGDFAISNCNDRTILNFRLPSYSEINFVEMAKNTTQATSVKKTRRNDECPCGSGKKYKNCCGRYNH